MLGVLYYPGTQHALRQETFDFHHCWDSYADIDVCVWVKEEC